MTAKREKVLDMSHRIMAMRADAQRAEETLQRLRAEIRLMEEALDRLLDGGDAISAARSADDLLRAAISRRFASGGANAAENATLGDRILGVLASAPNQLFPVGSMAKLLSESPNTVRTVLWRLARSGEIVRHDKGLYRARRPGEVVVPKTDEDDAEMEMP
ncbi:hypothetical protein HI113_40595 [Corallococcus exiguus]|uniref:hypothetical protein n=1 Tax=Corallococcus exiguus TaxID=83462 RepID=UPI001473D0B6|nr:hypothetical protein [Corallococcus exiguus]NNC00185.1 hypothetical protein [Corallococcus exiguus]